MSDPTTTTSGRQPLLDWAEAAVARGDTIHVLDLQMHRDGALTPAELTDALLHAGADVAEAERLDTEVHAMRAAGDPAVRSRFYGDVA